MPTLHISPIDNDKKDNINVSETDNLKKEDIQPDLPKSENDITALELSLLDSAGMEAPDNDDDKLLLKSKLDNVDEDGEILNENVDNSGEDLDVPGSETDDELETIGEEDEENNSYSISKQGDDEEINK